MNRMDQLPVFGVNDRAAFRIGDFRTRADTLKHQILPRLKIVSDHVTDKIEATYGRDALSGSSLSLTPQNRETAASTTEISAACVGLVGKQIGGKYLSVKLVCLLSDVGIRTLFWVNKKHESKMFEHILIRYDDKVGLLLKAMDRPGNWTQEESGLVDDLPSFWNLKHARIRCLEHLWHVGLCGRNYDYPINTPDLADILAAEFLAMFPIYKTVVDLLHGENDQFELLFDIFMMSRSGLPPLPLTLTEGQWKDVYRKHRHREKKLRDEKMRQASAKDEGRLKCEVPGCGFDFLEVYGEVGRNFAHVHHRKPLANSDGPIETSIDDLSIVCANCHAMIHRGRQNRPFEGLIKTRG